MKNPFKKFFNMSDKDKEVLDSEMPQTEGTEMDQATENLENEGTSEEVTDEKSEIIRLKADLEEAKQKYLYLYSDFDGFRRNTAKERLDLIQTAGRDIMSALLPILDDFDRAAKNEGLNEGTQLIYKKMLNTLQSKLLVEMDIEPGSDFDSEQHEAIANIPAPNEEMKGKIIDIVEKGYYLGDKIIRHAKVVVGN